jgi:cysteine-rich repeat protein
VADVTPYVTGDGTYMLSGLAALPSHQVNGASLVVLFDDGNPANNRDLVFFEGNDSTHIDNYGGVEDRAWHAVFDNIVYETGAVRVQLHVADGQSTSDGALTFLLNNHTLVIPDDATHFDGLSVPLAGASRASGEALWDIHTFDITSLFRSHGTSTVYLDTPTQPADCTALVLAVVDTSAGSVPVCGDGVVAGAEECDDGNLVDGDCCDSTCHAEPIGTVCGNPGDPCLESHCDGTGTCDSTGRSCRMPSAARAGSLAIQLGRQDRLTWKWRTGVSAKADFGDPFNDTDYDLCLLDAGTGSVRLLAHAHLPAGESCGTGSCWKETAAGYEYRNPAAPLQHLSLQGGPAGLAKITARALGQGLSLPPMPLAPPVMMRLHARDGECWGVNFSVPQRNGRHVFLSRGDFFNP